MLVHTGAAKDIFSESIAGDGFSVTFPTDPCEVFHNICREDKLIQVVVVRFKGIRVQH